MKILKILLYLIIITNFILLGYLFLDVEITGKTIDVTEIANVTKVVDGDTIETDLGKVRLLGINTPERSCAGYEEAKNFLLLFEGKQVSMVRTVEDTDRYGRLLRYIFYGDLFVNEEILGRGLAHVYIYDEDEFSVELREAEEKARGGGVGIWEKSDDRCTDCIKLVELNEIDPGEYIIFENRCDFYCDLSGWTIKDDSTKMWVLDWGVGGGVRKQIDYEGRIWNDAGDSLYLRDTEGKLVLFYRY